MVHACSHVVHDARRTYSIKSDSAITLTGDTWCSCASSIHFCLTVCQVHSANALVLSPFHASMSNQTCPSVTALQKEGLKVTDVVVLIDREQGGAQRMASNGLKLYSAFTLSFILETLQKHKLVSDEVAASTKAFIAANQTFKEGDSTAKAATDAPAASQAAPSDAAAAAKAAADAACAAPMPIPSVSTPFKRQDIQHGPNWHFVQFVSQ